MKHLWRGWLITEREIAYQIDNGDGTFMHAQKVERVETIIPKLQFWKCVLPWPGKRKWAETVQTKVALLGATPEYQAVSAWDWDEAWVIEVDEDNIIASSNKTATCLAYLIHRGVGE